MKPRYFTIRRAGFCERALGRARCRWRSLQTKFRNVFALFTRALFLPARARSRLAHFQERNAGL